jgi:putative nucleotidyltransferase with HDIG domain
MEVKNRILIIEDEDAFRFPLIKTMEREGYQVFGAANSHEAFDVVANNKIDLVVTDVRIPQDIDGLEIIKRIKEICASSEPSFIVMTGYAGDDAPIRAIRIGVGDFLFKPFDPEQFIFSVKKSLQLRNLEQQKLEYIEQIRLMSQERENYNLRLEGRVAAKTYALSTIFQISKEITSSLQLEEVLSTILEQIGTLLKASAASVMLVDEADREFFIAGSRGLSPEIICNARIGFDEPLTGWIARNRDTVVVDDIASDERFPKSAFGDYFSGAFIAAPLIFKNNLIGILAVGGRTNGERFESEDSTLVRTIADQASIAIANARLYTELKDVYLQVITTLNSIIELKDNYTKTHSERVTRYAVMVAGVMGMPQSDIETLRLACQLHDLGKIGIHDYILTKPDKLTPEEWEEMRQHPSKGVDILRPLVFLNEVIFLVEQHHEWFNGRGYPRGLKGDQIDIRARIMAVCDSFDAMTTHRAYSPALTLEDAANELVRCSGTQFDPNVVSVFLEMVRANPDLLNR